MYGEPYAGIEHIFCTQQVFWGGGGGGQSQPSPDEGSVVVPVCWRGAGGREEEKPALREVGIGQFSIKCVEVSYVVKEFPYWENPCWSSEYVLYKAEPNKNIRSKDVQLRFL